MTSIRYEDGYWDAVGAALTQAPEPVRACNCDDDECGGTCAGSRRAEQMCDTFCLGSSEQCMDAGRCVRLVALARQDPRIIEPR